jgi:hypothetical protein
MITGGTPYFPPYQALYNNIWTNLASNDTLITVSFTPTGIVQMGDTVKALTALQEGETSAIFQYKNFADTVLLETQMPLANFCVNKTIASGSFKNPLIWSKSVVPDLCDSIVIDHGFSVTVDTSVQCTALSIILGGTLTLSNIADTLKIGGPDDGNLIVDNYGTLNINNGNLFVNGRVRLNQGSTFNMSGGLLTIDGNTGLVQTSLHDSLFLFDVSSSLQSFTFTGGTLQITDPPIGTNSQAINCSYIFGNNSVLQFGNGISKTISNNKNGFGGNHLPSQVGNFILDAGTLSNNRVFINLSPLTVKKSLQVKSGNLIQSAPLNVTQ